MSDLNRFLFFELLLRFELRTSSLPRKCSTTELLQHVVYRAENGAQTRDPQLGRLVLYQLSYFRKNHLVRVGADGFEPPKSKDSRFTVCPIWPLWKTPKSFASQLVKQLAYLVLSLLSDSNQRPRDYKSRALAN